VKPGYRIGALKVKTTCAVIQCQVHFSIKAPKNERTNLNGIAWEKKSGTEDTGLLVKVQDQAI
jgi:hypothetical protein